MEIVGLPACKSSTPLVIWYATSCTRRIAGDCWYASATAWQNSSSVSPSFRLRHNVTIRCSRMLRVLSIGSSTATSAPSSSGTTSSGIISAGLPSTKYSAASSPAAIVSKSCANRFVSRAALSTTNCRRSCASRSAVHSSSLALSCEKDTGEVVSADGCFSWLIVA